LRSKTLVLGIGNSLLSDEGVGIHVVRRLAQRYPRSPGVEWLDGGTLSFTLAGVIAQARYLLVVDAARLDAPPGTIGRFEDGALDAYLGGKGGSVHEVGLADLLDMARLTGDLPERRCLIGVQPGCMDWGEAPTPEVAAAIPAVMDLVVGVIRDWGGALA
jgi:hydrogenase maturation protease